MAQVGLDHGGARELLEFGTSRRAANCRHAHSAIYHDICRRQTRIVAPLQFLASSLKPTQVKYLNASPSPFHAVNAAVCVCATPISDACLMLSQQAA